MVLQQKTMNCCAHTLRGDLTLASHGLELRELQVMEGNAKQLSRRQGDAVRGWRSYPPIEEHASFAPVHVNILDSKCVSPLDYALN